MSKTINAITVLAAIVSAIAVASVLAGCVPQETPDEAVSFVGREVELPDGRKVACVTAATVETSGNLGDAAGIACDWSSSR